MRDVHGKKSCARWLLWITTMFTIVLIAFDSFKQAVDVPVAAYVLLGNAIIAFAVWAGAPSALAARSGDVATKEDIG